MPHTLNFQIYFEVYYGVLRESLYLVMIVFGKLGNHLFLRNGYG